MNSNKRLAWNSEEYNEIQSISVGMEKIWSPDVQIINRGHDFPHNEEYKYKAKIYSDGWVYAIRNYRFKADINVNIELGSSKSFIFLFFFIFLT